MVIGFQVNKNAIFIFLNKTPHHYRQSMKHFFLILLLIYLAVRAQAQADVPKTYSKPVIMHYMPWFDTPEFNGQWGWHWTMNNRNPDIIVDPMLGKREIASHFYPLIGPYASKDSDVIEYHLLLMKYAGVDGVIIDWYGVQGRNGDINSLLTNSNALIDMTDEVGLQFSVMLEDRFADSIGDGQANFAYLRDNYFTKPNYTRHGIGNAPLIGVFGPITFELQSDWDSITPYAGEDITLLPLWYESNDMGIHADGEYSWIYEVDSLNDYARRLERFYQNRAPGRDVVMGIAYPGFKDFYAEGNAGNSFFTIPHQNTLDTTFQLTQQYDTDIDLLQLATWNDFGEGTMFEPTLEFGYQFLVELQQFLGVGYGEKEFMQIHRLYLLRKKYTNDMAAQTQLDQVFDHFTNLRVDDAINLMDVVDGTSHIESAAFANIQIFPNPTSSILVIKGSLPFDTNIELFTVLGEKIRIDIHDQTVDLSGVKQGMYWLVMQANGKRRSVLVSKW
ncbi:MAG: T9SS type A sorting domain-containing protein [Rhodothermales bacterium]